MEETLLKGSLEEKKRLIRPWIDKIKLAPERYEVDILYQIPEPVVDRVGAGALFISLHQ
jgi:hypothetical protein